MPADGLKLFATCAQRLRYSKGLRLGHAAACDSTGWRSGRFWSSVSVTSDPPVYVESCPHCGQRNRVRTGTVRCGRCRGTFVVQAPGWDTPENSAAIEQEISEQRVEERVASGDAIRLKRGRADGGSIEPWIEIGVPRDSEHMQRLLAERPPYWEFLLLAGEILGYKAALESKWIDHDNGIGRVSLRELDELEALALLSDRFGFLRKILTQEMRVLDPESKRRAFGGPQESGDRLRILNIARHLATGYEAMLDWAAELRGLRVPEEVHPLLEISARMADQPIGQVRAWFDQLVRDVDELPGRVAKGENVHVNARLTLSVDETVWVAFRHRFAERAEVGGVGAGSRSTAAEQDLFRAQFDTQITIIELQLRDIVLQRLGGASRLLPSHVAQKASERINDAARKQPGVEYLKQPTLATVLEYLDLRELLDTITAKSLWREFDDVFGTKEQLNARLSQLAELRNALRHSRTMTGVTVSDGEAAILWFRQAFEGAERAPIPGEQG
jgi:hypothetical protein